MLIQAEQIDLAILTLLVGWHDSSGFTGYRNDIEEAVKHSGITASTSETLEELILLHRQSLVAIDRYESGGWFLTTRLKVRRISTMVLFAPNACREPAAGSKSLLRESGAEYSSATLGQSRPSPSTCKLLSGPV
jgi:hypothetical protein